MVEYSRTTQVEGLKGSPNNPVFELTEVKPSPISGLGLFAKRRLPKGTLWWNATPEEVLMFPRNQYQILCQSVHSPLIQNMIKAIQTYSYYEKKYDALILCVDNARFVNHSFTPNSGPDSHRTPLQSYALRDIEEGEEILENYLGYDQCPWADVCDDFLKPPAEVQNK